jgi:hypothetical protein
MNMERVMFMEPNIKEICIFCSLCMYMRRMTLIIEQWGPQRSSGTQLVRLALGAFAEAVCKCCYRTCDLMDTDMAIP